MALTQHQIPCSTPVMMHKAFALADEHLAGTPNVKHQLLLFPGVLRIPGKTALRPELRDPSQPSQQLTQRIRLLAAEDEQCLRVRVTMDRAHVESVRSQRRAVLVRCVD